MSKNELINLELPKYNLTISTEVTEKRDALIKNAGKVVKVEDDQSNVEAQAILAELKRLSRAVENSREDVKAPVLEIGRRIDGIAKDFRAPIEAEFKRVNELVLGFAIQKQKEAEEIARQERLKREQAEREAREAEEKLRKAQAEAAEKKRLFELAQQQAKTKEQEDLFAQAQEKAAEEELQAQLKREDAQKKLDLERAESEARQLLAQKDASTKVAGSGVHFKEVWMWEVLDARQLYAFAPELCEIVPKAREITKTVNEGAREIAGVRIWSEKKTGVR